MSATTSYKIIDRRTGQRVSQANYGPAYYAHLTIAGWRYRDRMGGRPDLHDTIPHLAIAIDHARGET